MAASTPWTTGLTMVGWGERHATPGTNVLWYPVNSDVSLNPLAYSSAAGRRFLGYWQRSQNRPTGAGTAGLSVNVDITGQDAVAAATDFWYGGKLLAACGFDETSAANVFTYTLSSPNTGDANLVRADMRLWQHDNPASYLIADAVGGAVFNFMAGEIPNVTFNMTGILFDSASAIVTQPTPESVPFGKALTGCTFTLEAIAYVLRSLTISTNPVIAMRPSVAGTAGYAAPVITGYECAALARIELDAQAIAGSNGFEALFKSSAVNTALELSLKMPAGGVGADAGADVVTVTGDFLIDGQPQRVDDGEGITCWDIPLLLDPSSIAATADTTDGLKIAWSAT